MGVIHDTLVKIGNPERHFELNEMLYGRLVPSPQESKQKPDEVKTAVKTDEGSSSVWVTFQYEGWHNWPDAPDHRRYLASPHRHIFHYRVEVPVTHADRQIEFHDLRDDVIVCVPNEKQLGSQSCEHLAKRLIERLRWSATYKNLPWIEVTVSEDGENGATVRG